MTTRAKPADYGRWWNQQGFDDEGYRRIFQLRERAHVRFLDWYSDRVANARPHQSLLEVGCGHAYPYGQLFGGLDYHGTDISEKEIEYCKRIYGRDKFFVSDIIEHAPADVYDIVFSHAVIDHVYDMDAFLLQCANHCRGHFYVSAYWGWFPWLTAHEYKWSQGETCYYNKLSPSAAALALSVAGVTDVRVYPVYVDNKHDRIPFETVITGRGLRA